MLTHDTLADTYLDRESVSQGKLDIDNRVRTNLLPWTGQFSPQLIEELLVAYGQQSQIVMDPFVGSGTSLVEAARLGKAAFGSDINPAAAVLARVYCLIDVDVAEREGALESLEKRLFKVFQGGEGPLFAEEGAVALNQAEQQSALVTLWRESGTEVSRILMAALVVLCDFHRQDLSTSKVSKAWRRLSAIVRSLPVSSEPVVVYQADARALPIESDTIDLVLTSPPYINVHNYHQNFRRSVEALGWNVLNIAPSEIGSNRQNRGNRFLTVIQYALDMVLAIREMVRVAKPNARLILVLGRESTVRHVPFFNGELVAQLAVRAVGLNNERRQERQFVNRYGSKIREDILHFRLSPEIPDQGTSLAGARSIAGHILSTTHELTDNDTRLGIEDALRRIDQVEPSPLAREGDLSQVLP